MKTLLFSSIMNYFHPPRSNFSEKILCLYMNSTTGLQIIQLTNVGDFYEKRLVFPGQRFLFEAETEAILEIQLSKSATNIVTEVIPCQQLRIIEESTSTPLTHLLL